MKTFDILFLTLLFIICLFEYLTGDGFAWLVLFVSTFGVMLSFDLSNQLKEKIKILEERIIKLEVKSK